MVDPQQFGQLQATVDAQSRTLDQQNKILAQIVQDLQAVREQMAEAKGGWKIFLMMGGAAGAAGAGLASLFHNGSFFK